MKRRGDLPLFLVAMALGIVLAIALNLFLVYVLSD